MRIEASGEPLLSPAVERALAAYAGERDPLRVAAGLRRTLDEPLARRAAELLLLRRRAARDLPHAEKLLLTRKGLEQASRGVVALARARRLHALRPHDLVLDATAGIGGDAMALATLGQPLAAADRDEPTVRILRHNLSLVTDRPWVLRAAAEAPAVSAELCLLDPDRRAGQPGAGARARARREAHWSPSLEDSLRLVERFAGACLKLPPLWDPDRLRISPTRPHRWEWVSVAGEAKELTLWTGSLAEGARGARAALVMTRDGEAHRLTGPVVEAAPLSPAAARSVRIVAEAEPSVTHAGLVGLLGREVGLSPLAPGLPYLGGETPPSSPFLRSWRVRGSVPLDRRRVRELCRRFDVGDLVVKTRGVGESAAALANRLRGPGKERGLLIALGLEEGRHAFLVEDAN